MLYELYNIKFFSVFKYSVTSRVTQSLNFKGNFYFTRVIYCSNRLDTWSNLSNLVAVEFFHQNRLRVRSSMFPALLRLHTTRMYHFPFPDNSQSNRTAYGKIPFFNNFSLSHLFHMAVDILSLIYCSIGVDKIESKMVLWRDGSSAVPHDSEMRWKRVR